MTGEGHLTSGLTSRLILAYVEREGGARAVRELLELCELTDRADRLRDETFWFDFEIKMRLFEAASVVLGDPHAARHIGGAALDLNAFTGLKLALRTFGSPRLVYGNLPSTASKFTWAHRLVLEATSETHARFRYTDVSGSGYHRSDCEYTIGLFSAVPTLFARPPARVRHRQCGVRGDEACVYEVTWEPERAPTRRLATRWAAVTAAALGAAAVAPSSPRLRHAAGVPLVGGALVARSAYRSRGRRRSSLEAEVRDQKEAAERLSASMRDMVSDLRLGEVLDKILESVQAAVTGREFALLVSDDEGLHCRSSSRVPRESLELLERWAEDSPAVLDHPVKIDDLASLPALEPLASDTRAPLGALYSAPLTFRHSRLGALVGLAHGADAFSPQEIAVLDAYADQAAIALANARLFERLESLARHDSLTGLLNHGEFQSTLARELEQAERYGTVLSVMMLDLDGFKAVNDEHGHAEGDRVLRMVASVLTEEPAGQGSAYRIGGDEFALLAPGVTAEDANAIGERVQEKVAALGVGVTMSFGLAMWPDDGPSQSLVLFNADRGLYQAKTNRGDPRRANRGRAARRLGRGGTATAAVVPDPASEAHHLKTLTTALARAVDAKDAYTRSHSETVSETCRLIAEELGLGVERVSKLGLAGLLHDVGKIGVADAILQKPAALTPAEYEVMKTHTTLGHSIVSGAELEEEANWILRHHEQPDGRGYPDGLAGRAVPLESRVILVADAFEAMTSDRPYRPGRPVSQALAELDRHAGTQFDAACVTALRAVLSSSARQLFERGPGTPVTSG